MDIDGTDLQSWDYHLTELPLSPLIEGKTKLTMPVLALGGDHRFGNLIINSMRTVANDVRGGVVPNSSHWIPEEWPDFLIKMLENFFGGNTTNTSK